MKRASQPGVTPIFLVTTGSPARSLHVSSRPDASGLLERLQRGDSAALDSVYAAQRVRLLSYLTRMLGERSLAEDLLQETFLRLCRFAPQLAPDTDLSAWLLTVARNLCMSHFRRQALDLDRVRNLAAREPPQAPTPLDALTGAELEARLSWALSQLAFEQRELLILLGVEGMPASAVAAALGVSDEALRQRLSRARKQLASLLRMPDSINLGRRR